MNMKCHKLSPTAFSPMGGGGAMPTQEKETIMRIFAVFLPLGGSAHTRKKNYTYIIFLKFNTAPQF